MKKDAKAEIPIINLASEPWMMEQIMDTERRIEKAFHEQTKFLSQKTDGIQNAVHQQTQYLTQQQALANEKLDTTIRCMVGLMITMIVTLVVAIFLQPHI